MTPSFLYSFLYCCGSQCCLKCVCLGWGAVSASLGLSPVSQFVSHLALSFTLAGVLCPPSVGCCVRLSPVLSPNLSPAWLYLAPWSGAVSASLGLFPKFVSHLALSPNFVSQFVSHLCLSPWLRCCVRLYPSFVSLFVSHLALSFTLAGVLCPPRWACLRSCLQICLPICLPSGFVFHLGCCVRLVGLVCGLVAQFVSHLALSFTLAGVACLRICFPICLASGFVFPQAVYCWGSQCCRKRVRLGRGAVSASLGLSPHLFPNLSLIWLCLPVLSFHLFPIWLCLLGWGVVSASLGLSAVSQFVSQFVFHLGWGAVSPSRGLSPNLSPIWLCLPVLSVPYLVLSGAPCPPRWACRPICLPRVSHFALSFTLAGALRPPRWACLPICLPPGIVFHLGWGTVSTSLGLSPNLSPIWLCLLPWLGCCVSLIRFVCGPPICLPSGFVSQFFLAICFPFSFVLHLGWGAVYT